MKLKVMAALLLAAMLPATACAKGAGEALGFSMLRAIYKESAQALISPWGLATALSMAAEGAAGETREEFLSLLGTGAPAPLPIKAQGVSFAAGAILDERFQVLDSYRDALSRYGADCLIGLTAEAVDKWASDKTGGLIDKVTDGTLPDDALMALLTALTLEAKWLTPFSPNSTKPGVFYSPEGEVTVDFLSRSGRIEYAEADGHQMARLPYEQEGLACYLLLPVEGGMDGALNDLADKGYALFDDIAPGMIELSIPRLSMDISSDLSSALYDMGLKVAMSNAADFSGIDANNAIKLGPVLQRTRLDLDEEGTRAASVTVAYAVAKGAFIKPEISMRLDRPFILLVRDERADVTLFAACVSNPANNRA